MKPPCCHFCHKPLSAQPATDGPKDGLVQFADRVPLPPGMAGHPHGLEWFCAAHFAKAQRLSDRTTEQAMKEMRR